MVVFYPIPSSSRRRHGHRNPRSQRRHYEEEEDEDEDDEDYESDSSSLMSEIYDGDSVASQVGNMYGGRMPGYRRRNGHRRGVGHSGHHQPHGPRFGMHQGGSPFHGHMGDRVAGMFDRSPYRIGYDYEGSEDSW